MPYKNFIYKIPQLYMEFILWPPKYGKIPPKFGQNSGQNSPKNGAKIPPAGVPNFVSKLHRKSHFLVGPRGPPKFGPPGSGTPKIYIKHKKRPFLGVQKKAPPFRGPKIRPAGRARRAPAGTARPADRHFTPRFLYPPFNIYVSSGPSPPSGGGQQAKTWQC